MNKGKKENNNHLREAGSRLNRHCVDRHVIDTTMSLLSGRFLQSIQSICVTALITPAHIRL